MNYDKKIVDKIYEMYYQEKIGHNSICLSCRSVAKVKHKELKQGPVPIFHVGKNYSDSDVKLVLIGRVAYGWNDIVKDMWEQTFINNNNQIDAIKEAVERRVEELFFRPKNRIFIYLNYALSKAFGSSEMAFDNIALTNYVHCNNDSKKDTLPQNTRNLCINNELNGFIFKELEILKPTHVISLTPDWDYTKYMKNIKWNYKEIDHPSKPGRRKDGLADDIYNFLHE